MDEKIHDIINVLPQQDQKEVFAQLLALPDDQFLTLKPVILDSFYKTYNSLESKMLLYQGMKMSGVSIEDYNKASKTFIDEIRKIETLSQPKIDFLIQIFSLIQTAVNECEEASKELIPIPIELCHPNAKIPTYAHETDGGADVYAVEDITLRPGEQTIVKTGLKIACPPGYAVLVHPRSGLSAKTKMRVCNAIGLIDSDYRSEIGVIIENNEAPIKDLTYDFDENHYPVLTSILHGADLHITKGERFAQLRLVKVPHMIFHQVNSVNDIEGDRGGGFGSTN